MDVKTIAREASRLGKKPTTNEALDSLKALVLSESVPEECSYHLAHLYRYFLKVNKTKKPKTPWEWVTWATAKEAEHKKSLEIIQVINGKAIATDTKRLHMINSSLEDGVYDISGEKIG